MSVFLGVDLPSGTITFWQPGSDYKSTVAFFWCLFFFQRFFWKIVYKSCFGLRGAFRIASWRTKLWQHRSTGLFFQFLFCKTEKSNYRFVCLYSWASKCRPGPRRFGTAGPWQSRVSHFWMFLFWNVFFGQSRAKGVFRLAWRLQPSQAKRSHRPASRPYTP